MYLKYTLCLWSMQVVYGKQKPPMVIAIARVSVVSVVQSAIKGYWVKQTALGLYHKIIVYEFFGLVETDGETGTVTTLL
jgi:hypothetical protein